VKKNIYANRVINAVKKIRISMFRFFKNSALILSVIVCSIFASLLFTAHFAIDYGNPLVHFFFFKYRAVNPAKIFFITNPEILK